MADLPLVSHALDDAFAHRAGRMVTAGEFLAEAQRLAETLPARRYVVNLCSDRLRFAAGFAASLLRGQISLMPPSHAAEVVQRLLREYPDVYCLTDGAAEHAGVDILRYPTLPSAGSAPSVAAVPGERVAAIMFTSGSTGDPLPHPKLWGGLVASAVAEIECLGVRRLPGLSILGTVPPQHMYGLESTVLMAMQGGLAMHAGRPFFPADICADLDALPRPRGLVTTPVHLRAILAEDGKPPPVDFLLCATAPLPADLAAQAEARFAAPLHEIYGCTETGQLASRRPTTGPEWRSFPGVSMSQDEKGTWVKGGHARTKVLLGDVIELRGEGRFLLHGRTSDLVNVAGKRTSLASLNHHLGSIPGVLDAAFVVPSDDAGAVTRLAAFVVAPGLNSEAILSALRERIDPAFLPRPLCMVDTLPRNETGKLTRANLDALVAKAG